MFLVILATAVAAALVIAAFAVAVSFVVDPEYRNPDMPHGFFFDEQPAEAIVKVDAKTEI